MNAKRIIKSIVPQFVWDAMRRLIRPAMKQPFKFTAGDAFRVPYRRANLDGRTFFLPEYALHRPAAAMIQNGQFYEEMTHKLVSEILTARPGDMIHAGTFFGDMVPTFAEACKGKVYAFEPVLENYVLCKLGIEANGLKNVVLANAGLANVIDVAFIDVSEDSGRHKGGSSEISTTGQTTAVTTVDALGRDNVSLVQLDVEGHELLALQGAVQTIQRCKPVIMIEDNNANCPEFLSTLGYAMKAQIPEIDVWQHEMDETDILTLLKRAENSIQTSRSRHV